MKRQFTSFILAAALSAFAGATFASAQQNRETADVNFSYQANSKSLERGTTTVKETNSIGLYQVSDDSGNSAFWNGTKQVSSDPEKAHLKFACYGDECVLEEVAMPGSDVAYQLSQKQIDRQLSHKIGIATMILVPLR